MPRTNVNSAPVEAGHGNVESLALHADDVLHRNLAVLRKEVSLSPIQIRSKLQEKPVDQL
jgi:hypothetical protein